MVWSSYWKLVIACYKLNILVHLWQSQVTDRESFQSHLTDKTLNFHFNDVYLQILQQIKVHEVLFSF